MPFVCIGGKRAGWLQKSIVEQVIWFHGQYDLTIVGVAKEAPVTSSLQFDALVPFTFEER